MEYKEEVEEEAQESENIYETDPLPPYETDEEYQDFFLDFFGICEYNSEVIDYKMDKLYKELTVYEPFKKRIHLLGKSMVRNDFNTKTIKYDYDYEKKEDVDISEDIVQEDHSEIGFIYLVAFDYLWILDLCIKEFREKKSISLFLLDKIK